MHEWILAYDEEVRFKEGACGGLRPARETRGAQARRGDCNHVLEVRESNKFFTRLAFNASGMYPSAWGDPSVGLRCWYQRGCEVWDDGSGSTRA